MSHRRVLRLAAFVVASGAVLAPTTAQAERVTVLDAPADAQKIDWELSGKNDPVFLPASDETSVDIVRTVVAHGDARLAVTVRYRDLTRLPEHETSIRVVTPRGRPINVGVIAGPGGRVRTVATRGNRPFSCRGLRAESDVELDRVRLLLPTTCFDAPRWVQVAVVANGFEDTATAEDPFAFELYFDDAHSDTLDTENWPVLGPKVTRN